MVKGKYKWNKKYGEIKISAAILKSSETAIIYHKKPYVHYYREADVILGALLTPNMKMAN